MASTSPQERHWWDRAADVLTVVIGILGFIVGAHDLVSAEGAAQLLAALLCAAGLTAMSRPLILVFRGQVLQRLLPALSAGAAFAITGVFAALKATNWSGTDEFSALLAVTILPLATAACLYALIRAVRSNMLSPGPRPPSRTSDDALSVPSLDSKTLGSLGAAVAVVVPLVPLLVASQVTPLLAQPSLVVDAQAGSPVDEPTRVALPVRIVLQNKGAAPAVVVGSVYWMTLEANPGEAGLAEDASLDRLAGQAFLNPDQPARRLDAVIPGVVEQIGWLLPDHLRIDANSVYTTQVVTYVPKAYRLNPVQLDVEVAFANNTLLRLNPSDRTSAVRQASQIRCYGSCLAYVLRETSWLVTMTRPNLTLTERWCSESTNSCFVDDRALDAAVSRSDPTKEDVEATDAYFGLRIASARWEMLALQPAERSP